METNNTRRDFLFKSLLAGIGISVLGKKAMANGNGTDNDFAAMNFQQTSSPFSLSALPYPYDALEPHIDRQTMEIHHTKHHQAYVTNLNKALESVKDAPATLEELLKNISKYPAAVRNNAGGHWNHTFFWTCMRPSYSIAKATGPSGKLAEAINSAFGSLEKMKEQFNDAAKSRFGSGWAWLVVQNGKLAIGSTPNQDNPLMDVSELKGTPVLALDVWEHAYYLKYQNKRPDYVAAWWNIVSWEKVGENFAGAK